MEQAVKEQAAVNYWDAHVTLSQSAEQIHTIKAITKPSDDSPIEISLYVSCYNEEKFILDTLCNTVKAMRVVDRTYEIIVIDDCSKDRSVEIVKKFIFEHPEVNIMLRQNIRNKGLAQNYIDGAFIGRGKYYRLICGDNPEPFDTLVTVLNAIGEADIIVPYHLSVEGKSRYRKSLSKIYTWLINLITGNDINYYNGLQIHLRHNVMRWHPNTRGFAFQASLLCLLLDMGFTYKQVGCVPIERRGGGGNALTWKNLRSVAHTFASLVLRRISPWA